MEVISVLGHLTLGGLTASAVLYTAGADLLAAGSRGTVQRGPEGRPAVALTFDDSPDPVFTPRIPEIFAQFDAPATFFIIGKQAEQHPEIVRSIAQAGHEIGNHTYRHRPFWLLPPLQTRQEIDGGTQVLTTIAGKPPRYLRPPWGRLNLAAVRHSTRIQQQLVLWSLRPEGWLPLASPARMARIVAQRLHPGAIINLHDGGGLRHTPARTAAALPVLLRLLGERGYRCLTLSDLLIDGPTVPPPGTLCSRAWEGYEWMWQAWYGVAGLGQDTVLALGPAIYNGPDLVLHDGTRLRHGAQIGELHLDRARVARLHDIANRQHVGFILCRERQHALQRLAQVASEHPDYRQLEAFRSTTLFWREATHLGFKVGTGHIGWRHRFLGRYQQMLLARDHPQGRRRLQGKRWEARTIWLSRQELMRRYGRAEK